MGRCEGEKASGRLMASGYKTRSFRTCESWLGTTMLALVLPSHNAGPDQPPALHSNGALDIGQGPPSAKASSDTIPPWASGLLTGLASLLVNTRKLSHLRRQTQYLTRQGKHRNTSTCSTCNSNSSRNSFNMSKTRAGQTVW